MTSIEGSGDTLPVDEGDLLVDMDQFIRSVDKDDLRTVISELGAMFYETGRPLQDLIDGGTTLIDAASANKQETISLLEDGPHRAAARRRRTPATSAASPTGMAQLTGTLRTSDQDIRTILQGGPGDDRPRSRSCSRAWSRRSRSCSATSSRSTR